MAQMISKEEFTKLCKSAFERPHGFVVIVLTIKTNNGKYRCGLDTFYIWAYKQSVLIIIMDTLLEKIVLNTEKVARNTEPKESFIILLSERSSQIRTKFNPLIQLYRQKQKV